MLVISVRVQFIERFPFPTAHSVPLVELSPSTLIPPLAPCSTEVRVGTAIFGSRGPLMVFNDSDDDGEAADGKKKATAASSSSTSTSTSTAAAAAVDKDVSDEKTR